MRSFVIQPLNYQQNRPMSKLYIPALALVLVGGSLSAQQNTTTRASKSHTALDNASYSPARPSARPAGARGEAFFTEDFSGGSIPAGWTNEDVTTPSGETPVVFVWSNDPAAVAPAALGYAPSANFNNPGASDGYLWANSDRGLPAAPPTQHRTQLTTTAIDCSAEPSVLFTMNSLIGVFDNDAADSVLLRVSTDMVNWIEFSPFPCLVTGAAAPPCTRWSANPQEVAVDISAVAAGEATVYLQLEWNGGWEYFWAVDDIALTSLPENEISMNYGYTSTTGLGEEYGRIPSAQLPGSMNVGAEVLNFGSATQTNVVVNMEVTDAGGNAVPGFSLSLPAGDIASQTTTVVDGNVTIPSLALGLYNATFTIDSDQIGSDEDPDNNSRVRNFEVTTDIYSLDAIGNHPAAEEVLSQLGSASFADNAEGLKVMTMYFVNTPMTVTGLEIALGAASAAGGSVVISILDTADVLATPSQVNNPVNGIESNPYVLTAADIAAGVITIPFPSPITLPVNAYYATATLTGNGTVAAGDPDFFILDDATVPQPALASAIYIPFDFNDEGVEGPHFYTNGNAVAIRMTTNPTISVGELDELSGVTMFPNPTNGILRINTDASEKYFVEVMNVLGEVVMTNTFAGNTVLDLAAFADGVYSVRVSNGTKATVQRIALN